jgi:protoporphyrinogen oxidase
MYGGNASPDGYLLERGPHSFRPRGTNGLHILSLIQELGLADQARGTSDGSKARLLWTKEHGIEALPASVLGMYLIHTLFNFT